MVNARNVLLWLHILVAFVALGPLILFDLIMPGVIRSQNVGAVRVIERVSGKLGPSTLLITALGIALVTRKGGYTFSDEWIIAALVLYVVLLLNGAIVLTGLGKRALEKLEAGATAEPEAAKLRVFGLVNVIAFVVMLWLMVAKPGF